jgi:hypothetical protein
MADQWVIVYNAVGGLVEIAFGIPGECAISDEELFNRYLELAGVNYHGEHDNSS